MKVALQNGYSGVKSMNDPHSLLGKLVGYIKLSEASHQKPTRVGFREFTGRKVAPSWGKQVILLASKIHIVSVTNQRDGRRGKVLALGPAASKVANVYDLTK